MNFYSAINEASHVYKDDEAWDIVNQYKDGLISHKDAYTKLSNMGFDSDEILNYIGYNEEQESDNSNWKKYQDLIESTLEKAHESMDEDTFMDFCTGVINLCQNYMGDLDQYDGYLESEFTTPCTDDGSELAKSYGLTVKSKEKTSDTSTPYVCKFTGPKESIVKMIKEKFNSGDDSVTEETIKEIKDSENETKECDTPMKESNYDESIFTSIENALTDSGLDVTRYTDAGMMTKNLGWVVSSSEGEVYLTCDGTYLSEGDIHTKECNCKECQLSRLNERVESLKERCDKDKLMETKDTEEE